MAAQLQSSNVGKVAWPSPKPGKGRQGMAMTPIQLMVGRGGMAMTPKKEVGVAWPQHGWVWGRGHGPALNQLCRGRVHGLPLWEEAGIAQT